MPVCRLLFPDASSTPDRRAMKRLAFGLRFQGGGTDAAPASTSIVRPRR
jgi:hypothetical protein